MISLADTAKPNIVYILADDLGYGDVKCCNPEGKIATPNMDKLAAAGMIFTDCHSSSAVCSPGLIFHLQTTEPRRVCQAWIGRITTGHCVPPYAGDGGVNSLPAPAFAACGAGTGNENRLLCGTIASAASRSSIICYGI
jgi:hypothetical protein